MDSTPPSAFTTLSRDQAPLCFAIVPTEPLPRSKKKAVTRRERQQAEEPAMALYGRLVAWEFITGERFSFSGAACLR